MTKPIFLLVAGLFLLSQQSLASSKEASEELPSLTPSQVVAYNQLTQAVVLGDVKAVKNILASNRGLLGVDDERDASLMAVSMPSPNMPVEKREIANQIANLLLDNHALISWVPSHGYSLLLAAIMSKQKDDLVLRMIEMGADPSAQDKREGGNALMAAVSRCSLKLTDVFLKKNVDVNAKLTNGSTALHIAVDASVCGGAVPKLPASARLQAQLIKKLLDNGANVNVANKSGETPLSIAKKNNDAEIIKQLETAGAK